MRVQDITIFILFYTFLVSPQSQNIDDVLLTDYQELLYDSQFDKILLQNSSLPSLEVTPEIVSDSKEFYKYLDKQTKIIEKNIEDKMKEYRAEVKEIQKELREAKEKASQLIEKDEENFDSFFIEFLITKGKVRQEVPFFRDFVEYYQKSNNEELLPLLTEFAEKIKEHCDNIRNNRDNIKKQKLHLDSWHIYLAQVNEEVSEKYKNEDALKQLSDYFPYIENMVENYKTEADAMNTLINKANFDQFGPVEILSGKIIWSNTPSKLSESKKYLFDRFQVVLDMEEHIMESNQFAETLIWEAQRNSLRELIAKDTELIKNVEEKLEKIHKLIS